MNDSDRRQTQDPLVKPPRAATPLEQLNRQWNKRMSNMLLILLGLYLLVVVEQWLSVSVGSGFMNGPAGVSEAAALMLAGCAIVTRRARHRDSAASATIQSAAGVACGVMVGHSLLNFYWTGNPQVVPLSLVLLGASVTFHSRLWLVSMWSLAAGGWVAIALSGPYPETYLSSSLSLGGTMLLSGSAYLVLFRRRERAREAALLQAEQEQDDLQAQERFQLALEGTQDGLWHWDLKKNSFRVSPTWELLLGLAPGEASHSTEEWFKRVHPGYLSAMHRKLSDHIAGKTPQFRHEHRIMHADGSYIWVVARGTVTRDASGEALAIAGSHSDISELIDLESGLLDDAFQDRLTGLPNRHFFMGRLETAITNLRQRQAKPGTQFAVLFLDLNKFKAVNDTMGHLVGDQLLSAVAGRLRHSTGQSDVVSRFAGDEFVVLLSDIRTPEEAVSTARRIAAALAEPYNLSGREVRSGCSVGIVLSRESFIDGEALLHMADAAMYHAKALPPETSPSRRVCMFQSGMMVEANRTTALQKDLARAVQNNELVLHYQPCIALRTGRIHGVEALIRWNHTKGGLLAPSEFIPLAEESGLIHDIGEWALREACKQAADWQKAGMDPVKVAVNLSARQLQQRDLPDRIVEILHESKLDPRWLDLELTETALMDSIDHAEETLARVSELGIRTSIDDFGTGYSSMNYLRRFNFQTLKMDRCFVSDITTDRKAAAVARGLISMAHNLDLSVVAEGVEFQEQLQFLVDESCDHVQGFLASRPLPADQAGRLLRSGNMAGLISGMNVGGIVQPAARIITPEQFSGSLGKLALTR